MTPKVCPVCGKALSLALIRDENGMLHRQFIHVFDCAYVRGLERKVVALKRELDTEKIKNVGVE